MDARDLVWGVDLGGTKIELVVLSSPRSTETLIRTRVPTESQLGYESILERIATLIARTAAELKVSPQRVGFGTPGVLDPTSQLLKNSNTACLNGKPLKRDLERVLNCPIAISNDANCFALAEASFGASRGSSVSFGVIMGSGVGGGVVVDGRALYGAQGIAGEWGHNILLDEGPPCYCGKRGCVEQIISGPALERFYADLAGQSKKLPEIAVAAREGTDSAARKTIDRLTENFGRAISVIINILDPDVIVLGGGVSNTAELYSDGIAAAARYIFNDSFSTKIVQHHLGDSAGVFGAAMLVAPR